MKKLTSLFFLIFVCSVLFSQPKDKIAIKFAATITAEDAKKHLSVLASDEYEGRETGKEGQKKAAEYIEEYFKKTGLVAPKTIGEELKSEKGNSYLQKFPLILSTPESAVLKVNGIEYENLKDFYFLPFGNNLMLETKEVLFLGYGISDEKYDDYKNIEVKGKIVLVLEGEPLDKDSVSIITGTQESSEWTNNRRKKINFAKSKNAAALITVNSDFEASIQKFKEYLETPSLKLKSDKEEPAKTSSYYSGNKIPQVGITMNMANVILSSQKITVDSVQKKISTSKQPHSFEIKASLELTIKNKEESMDSENVLGMIEGGELREEFIFITAHYDHLGVRNGQVFNGADDDGSGTVAIMEIAEAFAKAKKAGFTPKRSVVFMATSGEEKGLLGSSYYIDNPIFRIENTVCDLNIDMIGRIDDEHKDSINYVYIIGSDKISTDLHKINEQANATYTNLKLNYKYNDPDEPNRFYYRSDHYNFAKKGIPIIFYFNGTHEDYHKETDEISKINFDLLTKRAKLVFYTAWEVANRKERIKSDVPQEKTSK